MAYLLKIKEVIYRGQFLMKKCNVFGSYIIIIIAYG